ncbi:SUMF1/EgtB/PvdO family nonheme iron enzyme [candidate division KSB1 bacterium]|nr:SUMF1/EgtB/PvdO family nonheme iron enzyme [candidate division KSB1 bacterium]
MRRTDFSLIVLFMPVIFGAFFYCSKQSDSWINPVDGAKFVRIPAGELEVILKDAGGEDSLATILFPRDFWMASTEVSVEQFARFVAETGYITMAETDSNKFNWRSPGFEQEDNHPVVYVTYRDAQAYAQWAQSDLPTETEWLYACRAGTETTYFWGDSLDEEYFWHRGNTLGIGTRPVGTKPANPWGLYNMIGNVREYVTVCDIRYRNRGISWTRCASYRTRQGFVARDFVSSQVEPRLTECKESFPYLWDDDRGFRCVKRNQ